MKAKSNPQPSYLQSHAIRLRHNGTPKSTKYTYIQLLYKLFTELYKHFLEGAETFDTRTWVAAVCVVMGTLAVLAAGTCAVLCREWRRSGEP